MRIATLITALSLFLVSCQKEIDWSSGMESALLIKMTQKTGSDSAVINFTYDGSKRLIMEKTVGMSQGINVGNELKIVRNGSGIITKTIQKSEAFITAGIDSVETIYHYNTTTNRYTAAVFQITLFGFTVTDSATFTYDGNGNIITAEHFQQLPPLPYFQSLKQEYTYSAGNLVQMKQSVYDPPGGMYELISTFNYTYDSKKSPLIIGKEAIVLNRTGFFGNNNATRAAFIDATDPANNFTTDFDYSYDLSSKPLTAVSTMTPPGTVSNITYFYQ